MTRDDIIRWAREAGWSEIGADLWGATNDGAMSTYALERFAAIVAAAEREECAKEALATDDQGSVNQRLMQKRIAAAIRARGEARAKSWVNSGL